LDINFTVITNTYAGENGEKHWQTLSHNVSSAPPHEQDSKSQL
jgi:hypothetical protein